jgi:hypothetical protein
MKIRALDSLGDWLFGKGIQSYALADNAIGENIQTRILSFFKDCWFDQNAGLDWFRLLGSKGTEDEITLSLRALILQSYGVVKCNELSVNLDRQARNLSLQYSINTINSENYTNTVEVL